MNFTIVRLKVFQSTLPRRERRRCTRNIVCGVRISIHAPTKGATTRLNRMRYMFRDFNPRSHEGSDSSGSPTHSNLLIFQSTLPRRERHLNPCPDTRLYNFNPRSHEGSDKTESGVTLSFTDFNPRSHEGSDFNFSQKSISIFSKNHKFFFFITKYFLSYLFFFQKIALFVHISECESPYNFMPTSHSRFCIVTKSESRLLQFHGRHLYALLLSDTYFPNNKISNYQRSHQ